MDIKNNKPKRSYIPQSIGDTIRKVNRSYSSKLKKIDYIVHSKWPEIVGSYFAEQSEPLHITKIPDYENDFGEKVFKNILNVSVSPAAALEFQHFKSKILEKINSFFGYKAIIEIKIQQNFVSKNITSNELKNNNLTDNESEAINDEVNIMKNQELKNSLKNLGLSISRKEKND